MYIVVHLFFAIERTFLFNILFHHNEIYIYTLTSIYPYSYTYSANVPISTAVLLTTVKDDYLFIITCTSYMFTSTSVKQYCKIRNTFLYSTLFNPSA